mmetsp:Transcript_11578/g.17503  ORF Transcript_11578/g.17503 Transcript_11578/m.17503 type:complete len:169 (+) Transcript_11578:614-1120(+)
MEFGEDSAIADEDLGIKDLESKSHPVYKDMIKRFLPKKQRNHLSWYSHNKEKAHDDAWDSEKYDKEKEGILPAPGEIDEDDYHDDYYGNQYYYDNSYFRQNDYYNYERQHGIEKDKYERGDREPRAGESKDDAAKGPPAKPEEKKEQAAAKAPAKTASAAQVKKVASA